MSTSITSDLDQRQRLREAAVNADAADTTATNAQSLAQAAQIAADAAQAQADAAASAATSAQATADGKNAVTYSSNPPSGSYNGATGDLWYQYDGSNRIIGMWVWNNDTDSWDPKTIESTVIANLDAGKITTGYLDANRIAANSITTSKLSATAIDGMVVTGATLRTAASGQRVQIDTSGLRAYNSVGTVVSSIDASTGAFTSTDATVVGTFRNAPEGSNRIEIKTYGSTGWGASIGFLNTSNVAGHALILDTNSAQLRPMANRAGGGSTMIYGNYATSNTGELHLYGNIGGSGTVYLGGSTGATSGNTVNIGTGYDVVNINGLRLKSPQSGTATVTVTSSVTGFIDVTFPTAFASAPNVVTTPAASTTYIAVVSAVSATGFRITVRHVDNTSASASVAVQWIAVGIA